VVCPHCKVPEELPPESLIRVGFGPEEVDDLVVYRGRGCLECGSTGFSGRVALYEVMPMHEEIRELVLVGASAIEIKRKGIELGMKTLRASGLSKVREGVTTVGEVVRVTVAD
jgi:type IV pilus assembly protein PilB